MSTAPNRSDDVKYPVYTGDLHLFRVLVLKASEENFNLYSCPHDVCGAGAASRTAVGSKPSDGMGIFMLERHN
jgi:hypothetical protein